MKDTERFRGGCWAKLNNQLGISLRSFPDTVLDVDKSHVSLNALTSCETFYEQQFSVKVYAKVETDEEDLPPEDEDDKESTTSSEDENYETVNYTRLVTHMQSLTFRPIQLSEYQSGIMSDLITIAQATDKLIESEVSVESDEYCEHLRKELNRCYDNFVDAYGKIQDYYSWFADRDSFWVDYRLIQYALCLENEAGQKVDLFYRRQTRPRVVPSGQIFFDDQERERIVRAYWWCRSYFNNLVDLEQIAEKSGSNAEIVEDTLLSLGLVDRVPLEQDIKNNVVEVVSEDENIESDRQKLESSWGQQLVVPSEGTYTIPVMNYRRDIEQVEVTGYIGKLNFLAITTCDRNGNKLREFPLVHLVTGLKLCKFASLSSAIDCMNQLENVKDLEAFFKETDSEKLASEYVEERELLASHLREYIHTQENK